MELFPYSPHTEQPIVERLEWKTDVLRSHDDTEERVPLRVDPRRTLEYSFLALNHGMARLDALLWGWQSQQYYVPIWTDPQRLAANLSSGSGSIPAVTEGYDFYDSGYAVLITDNATYEVVQVDTVGASSLTLLANTTAAWHKGSLLYPVRIGALLSDIKKEQLNERVARVSVSFDIEQTQGTSIPGTSLYLGTEVLEDQADWSDGQPADYSRKVQILDYDIGARYVDDHSELAVVVRGHVAGLLSRARIKAWRGWLYERQGRYAPFWSSQWQKDVEPVASIGPTDTDITIRSLNSAASYALDPGRRDLAFLHHSGQWYYRRITGVVPGGAGEEVITIDSALGIAAEPEDFFCVSWLSLSRLEADSVELAWYSSEVVKSSIGIRSIRE